MEIVWRRLTWSLFFLAKGIWPTVDENKQEWTDENPVEKRLAGENLADGLFAVLTCLKGDLDYFATCLGLRHYNSHAMCDFCPASRDMSHRQNLYSNFSSDATWPKQLFNELQWRALYADGFLHWIFGLPGLSNQNLEADELHVKYLGVYQYTIGSVLHILVFRVMASDEEANMDTVWDYIAEWYKRNGTTIQYNNLSISSFTDAEKPH